MDKEVAEEMKEINDIRIDKNIKGSHVYKPMIDPRLKYDSEFINFQKLLHTKFEEDAVKFIEKMNKMREETEKQREEEKKRNEKKVSKLLDQDRKSKKELYEKIKSTQKEFVDFLRKRQEYLENKKNGILSKKSWKNPNPNYKKYLRFIEEKKKKIHEFRKAFDWQLIKEHELKTKQKLQLRKEKREKTDIVKSKKLNFFTNKKAYQRVLSVDKFNKRKYNEPKELMKKRRQYSEIVRNRYKPRVSDENKQLTEKMQKEMNENIETLKLRRQRGLLNVSKSKTYLSYSRLIGQKAKEKKAEKEKSPNRLTQSTKNIQVQTSQNLGRSNYLDHVRSLNASLKLEKSKKKDDGSKRVINYRKKKIYGSLYNSYHRNQLEAEVKNLNRRAGLKQERLKHSYKNGLERIKDEEEADNELIESMMAKCLYNESQLGGSLKRFFKESEKKYDKPKTPINYKKARFKVTLKARDELIRKYRERQRNGGGGGGGGGGSKPNANNGGGGGGNNKPNANNGGGEDGDF